MVRFLAVAESLRSMSTGIRITTFGKLLIERNGMVLDGFVSTKAALLFVYLALHPGEHSRKKLAAMFWSETSDEQALKNLRTALSSVRQQVGDALIVSHEDLAAQGSPTVEVDAARFAADLKRLLATPHTINLLTSLQQLEALYQGEFLASIPVRDAESLDEWIEEQRRAFRELYGRVLLEIVEVAQKQGSFETGLTYAWKLVNHDPLWDAAQRHLLRLLAYTDRANDALVQYERFAALLNEELEAAPEAETTALYEQIRARVVVPPKTISLSSKMQRNTDFVEPAADMALAHRMLDTPNCRLLTLYGISGIGKTSLVTQIAFHRQHLYSDGVCFVSLSTAQTVRDLLEQTACALNLDFSSGMDEGLLERQVIHFLATRHLLLILDNYEQLLPDTGFIQQVLLETPSVQVIVTSQIPLNLLKEWLLPLSGLRVPEVGAANAETYEAVRLFEITARRVDPRFELGGTLDDVIRICQLVDHLPLGIVIAAGWIQFAPPSGILEMMRKNLLQVEAVHQDIANHHRSFQELLNAMLANLSPPEQQMLMALAIFEGTFDFKAALAVADATPKGFKALTDKSLVQRAGEFRYCVHNIVRQAFYPQLERSPLLPTIAARYVVYFQQWCDDFSEKRLPLHELLHLLDIEAHNLWDVPGLSETERQRFLLYISSTLTEYWINRGYHARGLIPLLQDGGSNPEIVPAFRARGLAALARILERTSQYEQAWAVSEEALELEKGLNLPDIRARALRVLSEICAKRAQYLQAIDYLKAIIAMESQLTSGGDYQLDYLISLATEDLGEILMAQGDYEPARYYIETAIRRWHKRGEVLREAVARSYLGIIALKQGLYAQAFDLFQSILAHAEQANNRSLTVVFASYVGIAAMRLGDFRLAAKQFQAALDGAVQIDRKTTILHIAEQYAELSLILDRPDTGAQLLGFAALLRERLQQPVSPHNRQEYAARQQHLMARLGQAFGIHYQIGQEISLVAALELMSALGDIAQSLVDASPSN